MGPRTCCAWLTTLVLAASRHKDGGLSSHRLCPPHDLDRCCAPLTLSDHHRSSPCHTCHTLQTKKTISTTKSQQRHNRGPSDCKQVLLQCPLFFRCFIFFQCSRSTLLLQKPVFCLYFFFFARPTLPLLLLSHVRSLTLTPFTRSFPRAFRVCRMGQDPRRKTMNEKVAPSLVSFVFIFIHGTLP